VNIYFVLCLFWENPEADHPPPILSDCCLF